MTAAVRIIKTDYPIFESLRQANNLTALQLAQELGRERSSINRRLVKLEGAKYVSRTKTGVTEHHIWHPTKKAIKALKQAGRLAPDAATWTAKPAKSDATYQKHEAEANDLRQALVRAAADRPDLVVEQYVDTRIFNSKVDDRDGTTFSVMPDRFLEIRRGGQSLYFFVEVDRGTKPLETSRRYYQPSAGQMYAYLLYYKQGCFARVMAKEHAIADARRERWPFRVLATIRSREYSAEAHRNSLIEKVIRRMHRHGQDPPVCGFRGYAVCDEALKDPFGKIWLREVEVFPILAWLNKQPISRSLGACLQRGGRLNDLRPAIEPAVLRLPCRKASRPPGKRQERVVLNRIVRDRLIQALIATNNLPRYSILERWPPAPSRKE